MRITGAGRLADFRERLRWLMVRDEDAEEYSEHHAAGVLEYRFTPHIGWISDFSWNVVDGTKNNFGVARTGVNFAF